MCVSEGKNIHLKIQKKNCLDLMADTTRGVSGKKSARLEFSSYNKLSSENLSDTKKKI